MAFEVEDLVDPVMVLELVRLDVLRLGHPAIKDHQPSLWRGRASSVCSGYGEEVNWFCVSHIRCAARTR